MLNLCEDPESTADELELVAGRLARELLLRSGRYHNLVAGSQRCRTAVVELLHYMCAEAALRRGSEETSDIDSSDRDLESEHSLEGLG